MPLAACDFEHRIGFLGPQNTGKTQLLATAGASWGDDPDVTRGYNDRWSSTVAAAMSRIGMSNDGYGGFDETSVAALKKARKAGSAAEVAAKIMMLSDGAERDRYGGPLHSQPSRVMYVSSGNASLVEYLEGHPDVVAAHETRLITIRTDGDGREGIFDTVPKGFKTAAEAGNKLDWARKSHHGWLGQEFIRRLVDARFKDEAALIGTVEAYMEEFHQAAASITRAAPMDRVWRPFALAYATGRLA